MNAAPLVALASLRCADCGTGAVVAVHPGSDPECALGSIVIAREDRVRAWCSGCATRHGWLSSGEDPAAERPNADRPAGPGHGAPRHTSPRRAPPSLASPSLRPTLTDLTNHA